METILYSIFMICLVLMTIACTILLLAFSCWVAKELWKDF